MNREQKAAVIEEIAAQINESEAVYAVDYRGITVAQAAELRGKLREADATLRVVKNTLTIRAADEAGAEALKPMLEGPTALTFARGDAAAAAKAVFDYARTTGLLPFKGGTLNGEGLAPEQVQSIARLPTRDILNAQFVNIVASPLTGLVTSLSNLISGLARQLSRWPRRRRAARSRPAIRRRAHPPPRRRPSPSPRPPPSPSPRPRPTQRAADSPTAADEPTAEPEAAAEPATDDTPSDTDEEKE